jgi:MoaA/NifB/PqqE/SkfB family radical SAM enzyme
MAQSPIHWAGEVGRGIGKVGHFIGREGLEASSGHLAAFLPWYLKNRIRNLALPFEQNIWGRQDGSAQHPRFITIKPTFRCNLRCEFCRYVVNGQVFGKADYFLENEWLSLIDEVAPHKPYISITGGEPLLYPKIGELLERIAHHGLYATMVTNGTLLEKRAEAIMQAPPKIIQISIDGDQETHDQLRMVDGTFEKAEAGLAKLIALKKKMKSSAPLVVINSVISGRNYKNMPRMVEVAEKLGANVLNFQHFWFLTQPMIDSHNNMWGECFPVSAEELGTTQTEGVNVDELYAMMREVEKTAKLPVTFYPGLSKEELEIYYNQPEVNVRRHTPGCAWLQTAVFPNGDVSPCFDHIVGNIRESSFTDIWNGEKFRAHRMRLAQTGPYSLCSRCCVYFRYD